MKKEKEELDTPNLDEEINAQYDLHNLQDELAKSFDNSQFDFYNPLDLENCEEESISYDEAEARMKITKDTADEFLKNARSDRKWKSVYAFVLLATLIIQIYWLNKIFLNVGQKVLSYEESTFNIYITASLVEVIAIVKLVVKHLFHNNISASFKNVLEQSKVRNGKNKK